MTQKTDLLISSSKSSDSLVWLNIGPEGMGVFLTQTGDFEKIISFSTDIQMVY